MTPLYKTMVHKYDTKIQDDEYKKELKKLERNTNSKPESKKIRKERINAIQEKRKRLKFQEKYINAAKNLQMLNDRVRDIREKKDSNYEWFKSDDAKYNECKNLCLNYVELELFYREKQVEYLNSFIDNSKIADYEKQIESLKKKNMKLTVENDNLKRDNKLLSGQMAMLKYDVETHEKAKDRLLNQMAKIKTQTKGKSIETEGEPSTSTVEKSDDRNQMEEIETQTKENSVETEGEPSTSTVEKSDDRNQMEEIETQTKENSVETEGEPSTSTVEKNDDKNQMEEIETQTKESNVETEGESYTSSTKKQDKKSIITRIWNYYNQENSIVNDNQKKDGNNKNDIGEKIKKAKRAIFVGHRRIWRKTKNQVKIDSNNNNSNQTQSAQIDSIKIRDNEISDNYFSTMTVSRFLLFGGIDVMYSRGKNKLYRALTNPGTININIDNIDAENNIDVADNVKKIPSKHQ